MVEISVILATHNRAKFLVPCLASLCEQTLDPVRYEICVVNNACSDETSQVVADTASRYPKHRVFMVDEPIPGLSRARNSGLRATHAPLVAYIDDDGTVYPNWLELFVARFAELGPELAVVGGEIEPVWEQPPPSWLTDKMKWFMSVSTGLGPRPRFLNGTECTSEGNSCFRRSALTQAGNFPEELGRAGSCLLSGEQVVEAHIKQSGGTLYFDPAIILRHFIHADRIQPMWLRRRLFWQGVSSIAIRQYQLRHHMPVSQEAFINLPLKTEDWSFMGKDTADNLENSMLHFHSLGFVLALTGILPMETGAPTLRRQAFRQGIADARTKTARPGPEDLPLARENWKFINDAEMQPTQDELNRFRNLGLVLADLGFVSAG